MSQDFEQIVLPDMGLRCDNPECDWTDPSIKNADFPRYVNTPCPKCGENVLTEADMATVFEMEFKLELFNNALSIMSPEEREKVMKDMEMELAALGIESNDTIQVDIHNGIRFSVEKNTDSQE